MELPMELPMETTNATSQLSLPSHPPQAQAPPASSATPAETSAPVANTSTARFPVAGSQTPIPTSNNPNGINGLSHGNTNKAAATVAAPAANGDARPAAANSAASVSRPSPVMHLQAQTQTHTQPMMASPSPSVPTPATFISTPPTAHHQHQHQFQRPPMPRQSSGGSTQGKVPIVEPPGAYSRQAQAQVNNFTSNGFPSPNQEHLRGNSKFIDDKDRLTYAIQQAIPEAVRRVVRDNWEKCLLGSEFHHAFLLNAVIHHSNGVIIRRAIKEFGGKMVSESKHEVIDHFQSNDLDEVADLILNKCSNYFLDKAMERRLKTIDARSLINALARAERLGYENSDVLDDQREKVMPTAPSTNQAPNQRNTQSSQPRSIGPIGQGPVGNRPPSWQCRMCWRKFNSSGPYEYHVQKQACTKQPPNANGFPFSCPACGTGFITKVGQQYHLANNVCGDHRMAPATPMGTAETDSPILVSSGHNSPMGTSAIPPPATISSSPYYASTPLHSSATAGAVSSKDFDPYGHLNESTLAKLNEELRQAELSFAPRFKEAEQILDPVEKKLKIDGLHNSFSTKQSIIRKKFGVRLRNRRTKAEITGERHRMGLKHPSPSQLEETPGSKRQRTDYYISSQEASPPNNVLETPSKHLAVSALNSGLGGSSATAALSDPTRPRELQTQDLASRPTTEQPMPQNSLASYQRKGYRVSSHVQPSQPSPTSRTATQSPPNQRQGSASTPVVIDEDDDSSDTDSDGDEEIPASLPLGGRKTSGTPQTGLAGQL